jgi:hypothetical protein
MKATNKIQDGSIYKSDAVIDLVNSIKFAQLLRHDVIALAKALYTDYDGTESECNWLEAPWMTKDYCEDTLSDLIAGRIYRDALYYIGHYRNARADRIRQMFMI